MALLPDQKFSTFVVGGDLETGDIVVGLRGGLNTQFTWTGELPPGVVVPISQGGTGATTAAGARTNLGLGTMAVQNANAVDITGGVAALTSLITSGNITSSNGIIVSGQLAGGSIGQSIFYSVGGVGNLNIYASNSAGVFSGGLTNASLSAGRTWTLPDETGTIALTSGLTGYATKAQVQSSAFNYGVDTGTADNYIVNLSPSITSLTDGLLLSFSANSPNTTNSPNLTVNGQVSTIATLTGAPLSANDLGQGTSLLMYSVSNFSWLLMNPTISIATGGGIQNALYVVAIDSGTANTYVATFESDGANFSPQVGTQVSFQPLNSNTTISTLSVNGTGALNITLINGTGLTAGMMLSTKTSLFVFSYNNIGNLGWILLNPQGYSSGKVNNGLINQLAYYAAAGNTVSGLATAANGVLITSNSSVPSLLANGTAGYILTANSGAPPSWQQNGYLTGAVLLAPSGSQAITVGSLSVTAGNIIAGNSAGGAAGFLLSYPATTLSGSLILQAVNSSGNFNGIINNASLTAARTWTLPDATGTIALTSGGGALSVPSITFTTTSGIIGTTTNNSAAAGSVGEIISSNIVQISAVSVSSGTNNDITSISLTAGDWDVYGNIYYIIAGGAMVQYFQGWVNNASATSPDGSLTTLDNYGATGLALVLGQAGQVVPSRRFSLSTTTSIYLSCAPGFTVGTMTACGTIFARRRR